jgi:hypothetical protein
MNWSDGYKELQKISPEQVVDAWGSEKLDYDYANNSCTPGKMCGHYTQMVWRTTTTVGCAMAVCEDNQTQVWVCQYQPAGNIVGSKPYRAIIFTVNVLCNNALRNFSRLLLDLVENFRDRDEINVGLHSPALSLMLGYARSATQHGRRRGGSAVRCSCRFSLFASSFFQFVARCAEFNSTQVPLVLVPDLSLSTS